MKRLLVLSLLVITTSCSTPSAIKPVATAEVSNGTTSTSTSSDATATVSVASEGTPSSEATVVATPVAPAPVGLDTQQVDVAKEFLTAYHADPSGDSSAQYLSPELIKLYDSGKTIPSIIGVDATYTTVTIVDSKLFDDNQRAQITAKLDYANGSQTIDMTLALTNGTWHVAAVNAQPQK